MLHLFRFRFALLVAVFLGGCYPGAISYQPVTAHIVHPKFSQDWLYFRMVKRSVSPENLKSIEDDIQNARLKIRQTGDRYEMEIAGKDKNIIAPVTFHAPLKDPEYLVMAVKFTSDRGSDKGESMYAVQFMKKVGLSVEMIPMDRNFIRKWVPKNGTERLAQSYLLALDKDGGSPIIKTKLDLETAMFAASRMPKEWRTVYILQKEPPPMIIPEKPRKQPVSDNWHLKSITDPITNKVTPFANLIPTKIVPKSDLYIQLICDGGHLQVLAVNRGTPFLNETQNAKVALGLLEMRVNDKTSHKLLWSVAQGSPDIMVDLAGMGAFLKLATLFNPRVSDANAEWTSIWFLNTVALADDLLIRVTDARGTDYLATFKPNFSVRKLANHLPTCIKMK